MRGRRDAAHRRLRNSSFIQQLSSFTQRKWAVFAAPLSGPTAPSSGPAASEGRPRRRAAWLAAAAVLLALAWPAPAEAGWTCWDGHAGCEDTNPDTVVGTAPTAAVACASWEAFRGYDLWRMDYVSDTWVNCRIGIYTDPTALTCPAGEVPNRNSGTGCSKPKPCKGGCCSGDGKGAGPGEDGGEGDAYEGNPCNVITGNKYEKVTDFSTSGPHRLAFVRHYNSQSDQRTALGGIWRSNFDRKLVPVGSSRMDAWRPSGRYVTFKLVGTDWVAGDGHAYMTERLIQDAGGWRLIDADDTVETYDAARRLTSIRRRGGYEQTLAYNAAGQLESVTDSYGRQLTFAYTNGRLTAVTDPDGGVYRYVYDRSISYLPVPDRLIAVAQPDETPFDPDDDPTVTYLYEDPAHPFGLTGIVDENGSRYATYAYDAEGRATLSEHAGGAERIDLAYNLDGTTTVTGPLGVQTVYHFTTIQSLPRITLKQRLATANFPAASASFTYDANSFRTGYTDYEGTQTTYVVDARGLQTSRTEAAGTPEARTITTTWHGGFRLPTLIVAPGRTTTFVYDTNGLLTSRTVTDSTSHTLPYATAGQARTWTYTYTATGLLASVDGPRSDVVDTTTYTYDALGNRIRVTNALGQQTEITAHDDRGLPLTIADPNGVETDLAYDPRGRLVRRTVKGADGDAATEFTYDAAGQIVTITRPDGTRLHYEYDAAHRVTAVANDLGERIEYSLDAMGNHTAETVKSATAAIVLTQAQVFDELGRMLRHLGAYLGETTAYAYDANGNVLSETDPVGGIIEIAYDALDRLVLRRAPAATTDPAEGRDALYAYDDRDNQTAVTDQRGLVTSYVYNGFGEAIQQSSPDTGITVYELDPAGNRTRATDARGVVTDYAYDALNRPTAKTFPASPAEDVAYTYDDATPGVYGIGRLTGIADESGTTVLAYDARGNVALDRRSIGGVVHETRYAYDLADNLARIHHPSGRIVAYERDSLGRVSAITLQDDAAAAPVTVASDIAYHPFGPVASLTFGNGVTVAYAYDQDYRLTDIDVTDGVTPVQDLTLAYDLAGDITAITDNLDAARSQSFGYDARHRLTTATRGTETLDYGYDDVGNRLDRLNGVAETYSYAPDSNRLQSVAETVGATTRTLTHDLAGNITDDTTTGGADYDFAYNGANRLALVTLNGVADTEYRYNALGQRVAKAAPGGADTRHFHYDRAGRLIAESDGAGAFLAGYIYLDGLPVAQILPGSNSGAPADASLDNAEPGTAAVGAWAPATAGAGYQGADYMVHAAEDPLPAGGELIDNASAGFAAAGAWFWSAATAGSGFQGADYLHGSYATIPADVMVDNWDAGFSTNDFTYWRTSFYTGGGGFEGVDFFWLETDSPPAGSIMVDNRDAGFWTNGTWRVSYWEGGGDFEGGDFFWLDTESWPPDSFVVDNGAAGFSTNRAWRSSTWQGGGATYGSSFAYLLPLDWPPAAIVIDNSSVGFATTGAWKSSTWSGGGRFVNSNFLYTEPGGTPPDSASWTPTIPASGQYDVYVDWSAAATDRASAVTYTVHHALGSTAVVKDQRTGGGQWQLLGRFQMDPGLGHRVELSDAGADGRVAADAAQFTPAGAAPSTATWTPAIPAADGYDIYARWSQHANRTPAATYTIHHGLGSTPVVKDQRSGGGAWHYLGRFDMASGQNHRIELPHLDGGVPVADGMLLVPASAAPTTAFWTPELTVSGSYEVYAKWSADWNRTPTATYTIEHALGSTQVVKDQRVGGGVWNLLGTFQMAPGQGHRVSLPDAADGLLAADAVLFTPVGAPPITATWTPAVPASGPYDIFAKWSADGTRTPAAVYTIHHAGGSTPVSKDQRVNGGVWNLLGSFEMAPGQNHRIVLPDVADGRLAADAILLKPTGAALDTATWTPAITASGPHDVYARWPAVAGLSPSAAYTVHHAAGATPVTVNQRQNGGDWVKLGSFDMAPGAGHRIELAGGAGGPVAADAVYVVPTPTGPAGSFTWTPTVPAADSYKVYAKWPADASRATDAQYTIYHAGGSATLSVNQRQNGGQWHLLGEYDLAPGAGHGVELASSETGSVAADAIRLVAASAAPLNVNYIHADHLGTPQKMTDPAKAVVWDRQARPFGETISLTGTADLPLRFPGQYYDSETGLHYNYFRDYDPATGRYVQSDPIGLLAGLNTYLYVGGNPVLRVDPFGLEPDCFDRGDCLAQANENVKGCLADFTGECALAMARCAALKTPWQIIMCLVGSLATCSAICQNAWLSDRSLCELGISIPGYEFQNDWGHDGCKCI